MSNFTGTFTLGSTGLVTISGTGLTFTPTNLKFRVCAKWDGSQFLSTEDQRSSGSVDSAGNQNFQATVNSKSKSASNHCLYHYETVGGVATKVLEADFDSFVTNGFKLNVLTPNSNYQVFVEASDV